MYSYVAIIFINKKKSIYTSTTQAVQYSVDEFSSEEGFVVVVGIKSPPLGAVKADRAMKKTSIFHLNIKMNYMLWSYSQDFAYDELGY